MDTDTLGKEVFFISSPGDVTAVRRQARRLAGEIGFDTVGAEEIALVVSELSSNLHKHASQGVISLTPLDDGVLKGLKVEATDHGPGIRDLNEAFADGYSSSGTLGDGLGSVNRLMDSLEVFSEENTGTHITAKKWLYHSTVVARKLENPYDIGGASRSHPGMTVNGDAFLIKHWAGHSLVAVIDGVGHGQFAHKASTSARKYVDDHYRQPMEELFMGAARACRGTRGVVMAVADFDWERGTLTFGSVGNIETKVYNAARDKMFSVRRGIVGLQMPKPRIIEEKWDKGSLLVMFSDGVSPHWKPHELSLIAHQPAATIARRLLIQNAREHDDATMLIVKDRIDGH